MTCAGDPTKACSLSVPCHSFRVSKLIQQHREVGPMKTTASAQRSPFYQFPFQSQSEEDHAAPSGFPLGASPSPGVSGRSRWNSAKGSWSSELIGRTLDLLVRESPAGLLFHASPPLHASPAGLPLHTSSGGALLRMSPEPEALLQASPGGSPGPALLLMPVWCSAGTPSPSSLFFAGPDLVAVGRDFGNSHGASTRSLAAASTNHGSIFFTGAARGSSPVCIASPCPLWSPLPHHSSSARNLESSCPPRGDLLRWSSQPLLGGPCLRPRPGLPPPSSSLVGVRG